MFVKVLINSVFVAIFCLLGLSYQAVVNIHQSTSHPKGIIVVPENQRTSSLKVSFNETVRVSNVLVVCEIINRLGGETQVLFTNKTALIGQNNTTVNYRILSSGQPATVQCSAQSKNNHSQFRFSSSKGITGLLQVTSAPVVTICNDPVFVTSETGCITVQVQLSEAVSGTFPIVVNCSTVNNDGGPRFQFEATIVKNGQTTAKVPFTVLSRGTKTQSVQVICKAQTYNVTMLSSWFICGGTPTPTVTPVTTTAPSTNTTSNITTQSPITIPTPSPPVVLNITRFETSTSGVQYFQYLLETSAGHPVTFILNPLALQFHPSSVSIYGGYSVILSMNTPLTVPLDIECSLILLTAGQINTSAISCPTEPVSKITLTSSSVQLQLTQTEIQFKKSEVSKTLVISINGIPSTRLSDLVQLSCCPKTTAVLKPPSVAMYIWVDLHRYLPFTGSGTTTSTSPLDIDLTCPCNLKEGQCDTSCCCDKDCTTSERASFSCMKGFFGGDSVERPFEFSCQATWPDVTDLHPILCVTSYNSPFTGYWYNYTSPQSAKDVPEYKVLLQSASQKNRFSYQSVSQSQSSSDGAYKLGTSIKTAANSNDNKYLSATLGTLVLPTQVFSGLCAQTVPVRFLENSESTCVSEVVESLCTATSSLSASSYIMPRDLSNPPCPVPAAVLRGGTLSQNQNEQPDLADVEVQYFCSAGKSSPWRCAFDDGKTAPPLPVMNQTSQTCSNVVLNVTYHFETSGQKLTKVKVMVTLGNARLQVQSYSNLATSESPVNTITQYFQSRFVGVSNSSDSNIVSRSGNPGYIRGLPVLALNKLPNNSTLTSLPTLSLDDNSLCTTSSQAPINFGETSSSGCVIKLSIDDMRNCSRVRELVQANQKELLKPTHVGRTGNARATIDEDWLPIIRESVKQPSSESTRVGTCLDIPYGLVYEVLVSEAGRYKGVPQMEIVGLKMSYKYTTWLFQCVSGYGLSCLATSSSKIAPSVTVNATVTPTVTVPGNASLNRSSGQNNTTPNKGGQSSSYNPKQMYFSLEMDVIFIEVPSTPAAKVKRSADQSGICYQDVCKEELFYPLSPAYQGEPKDKVMTYSLLLLFIVLVTFYFTRPWG